jgi:hypothetical protein
MIIKKEKYAICLKKTTETSTMRFEDSAHYLENSWPKKGSLTSSPNPKAAQFIDMTEIT